MATSTRHSAKTKPRWHRRKDARPEEIVSAALEVFGEHGYAGTRLEEIARRAGVTKGTIYLYFDSKEALFQSVVRDSIVPGIERAERSAAAFTGSSADLIRSLVLEFWQFIGCTGLSVLPKLVMAEATNFPEIARFYHREVVERGHRLFAFALRRGMDAGEFKSVDLRMATRIAIAPVLLAVVNKHSMWRCVHDDMDVPTYLTLHVDLFLRGLAKPTAQELGHA